MGHINFLLCFLVAGQEKYKSFGCLEMEACYLSKTPSDKTHHTNISGNQNKLRRWEGERLRERLRGRLRKIEVGAGGD
jgi:hypothetical protein